MLRLPLAAAVLVFVAVPANAADVSAYGGYRAAAPDPQHAGVAFPEVKGMEYGLAIDVPVWSLPIAVGAMINSTTYDESNLARAVNAANHLTGSVSAKHTSLTYGPELVLSVRLSMLKPYARLGYLWGQGKTTETSTLRPQDAASSASSTERMTSTSYESGSTYGIGLVTSLSPHFGLTIEINEFTDQMKITRATDEVDGNDNSQSYAETVTGSTLVYKSWAIRLGLEVQI